MKIPTEGPFCCAGTRIDLMINFVISITSGPTCGTVSGSICGTVSGSICGAVSGFDICSLRHFHK